MDYLSKLENQSIYIMREAFNKFENLAMLWSIGKDSTVLLWLARKAFFGHVPFPLVHVDTTYKIPSMIEYRDRLVREWKLELVVGKNEAVLGSGVTYPNGKATRVECCGTLKKDGLKAVLEKHHFTGVIVGVRRDEEPTRAKERYFSPRDKNMEWNVEDQPPELWDQFKTDFRKGHAHSHPSVAALDGVEHLGIHRARKHSRLSRSTSRTAKASAIAASVARRARSRSSRTRKPCAKSSRNCVTPKPPSVPAAPRTRKAKTRSRSCAGTGTCEQLDGCL